MYVNETVAFAGSSMELYAQWTKREHVTKQI